VPTKIVAETVVNSTASHRLLAAREVSVKVRHGLGRGLCGGIRKEAADMRSEKSEPIDRSARGREHAICH
jgi:hypothetical protein